MSLSACVFGSSSVDLEGRASVIFRNCPLEADVCHLMTINNTFEPNKHISQRTQFKRLHSGLRFVSQTMDTINNVVRIVVDLPLE